MNNVFNLVRSGQWRTVARLAMVLSTLLSAATHAQQSSLKAKVEAHQRELKRRLEAARRESEKTRRDLESRSRITTAPTTRSPVTRPPSPATKASATAKAAAGSPSSAQLVRYNLPEGRTIAYWFLLEATTGQEQTRIAGIAQFDVQKDQGGGWQIRAHDNLRHVSNSQISWSLPRGSRLVDATFDVSTSGIEPIIEERLPYLLGRSRDWFFPPVPRDLRAERGEGYDVQRGSFLMNAPQWDKQNRGHFSWDVRVSSGASPVVRLVDRRTFSTDDRVQEISGSGEIVFDLDQGMMLSRTFRGTYALFGRRTDITLRVSRFSEQQLSQLVAGVDK